MKLKEVIDKAVENRDPIAAGAVVDFLRFKKGLTYDATFKVVKGLHPNLDEATWDALLYECDTMESH